MRKRRARNPGSGVRRRRGDHGARRAMTNGHVAASAPGLTPGANGRAGDNVVALLTRPSSEACATAALEANRCPKCRSTFVMREPAFLHCHYCGAMTRIPDGSLAQQELFELRSGLRLAS
jgi:hypothetical protein